MPNLDVHVRTDYGRFFSPSAKGPSSNLTGGLLILQHDFLRIAKAMSRSTDCAGSQNAMWMAYGRVFARHNLITSYI